MKLVSIRIAFQVLMLLLLSSEVSAATTGNGNVTTLMNAYGGWIINLDTTNNNSLNCSKPLLLESSHAQYKELYSYILTAYMSGKPITIYTSECNENGYSVITNIWSGWGA